MNVLFGMPRVHETGGFGGEIYLDGEKTTIASPHDAMTKGIGMVHQEFMLLPGFTHHRKHQAQPRNQSAERDFPRVRQEP